MEFEERQYDKLIEIIDAIKLVYTEIKDDNIVGHSEVSPDRKNDPGPFFYWNKIRKTK